MADGLSRKLAILLHADVVGSTALVRSDETIAHKRIREVFTQFSEVITQYNGTAHEIRGDALTAEFSRASDAVSASLHFQQRNAARNAGITDGIVPELRIGIAMGEVVVADNTITGDGIVLAQRLEQIAQANGVCIQEAAAQTIPRRFPFAYLDLGKQDLKGFSDPVSVLAVSVNKGSTVPPAEPRSESHLPGTDRGRSLLFGSLAALAAIAICVGAYIGYQQWKNANPQRELVEVAALPLPDLPSIAVLPFENMSGDAAQDYFSDGIAEDLITDLSKLSGLFVIARNSSFAYKGKTLNVAQIAKELGVRYILEGSVRRAAQQVRINAQLVDASSGGQVWAERYDGSATDVFSLQDQVTFQIVESLSVALTPSESSTIEQVSTKSVEAHDAYLLGLSYFHQDNPEDNARAKEQFERAIGLDPDFQSAHAALAKTYALGRARANINYANKLGINFQSSVFYTLDSLDRLQDEDEPEAHVVRSWLALRQYQHEIAIGEAGAALRLSSSNVDATEALAEALIFANRPDEGKSVLEKALRLNPVQIARPLYLLGLAEFTQGNVQKSIEYVERANALAPGEPDFDGLLAAAYGALGLKEKASVAFHRFSKGFQGDADAALSLANLRTAISFYPFTDATVLQRFVDGLRNTGAPYDGHLPLTDNNRLTGPEIKSLLFGATITGTDLEFYESWTQHRMDDGRVEHVGHPIHTSEYPPPTNGIGRIVDDRLCETWERSESSLDTCVAVFRMLGTATLVERRGDYVMVPAQAPQPFRIANH